MIGTLIVTQGGLAREFLAAAREIAGDLVQIEAVSLDWRDGLEEAKAKVAPALARLDTGEGVLVLADTFGGTPCNVALAFQVPGHVEVVTGVNLPMVMRLACGGSRRDTDLGRRPGRSRSGAGRRSALAAKCGSAATPRPRRSRSASWPRGWGWEPVIEREVEIVNRLGLHARAAAKLVHMASGFDSHITLAKDGEEVDAKSILGILLLAAAQGSTLTVRADGDDAPAAIEAVTGLIADRFEEGA